MVKNIERLRPKLYVDSIRWFRLDPVAAFLMVMVALGRIAPLASRTVPVTDAVSCAAAKLTMTEHCKTEPSAYHSIPLSAGPLNLAVNS